MNKMSQICSHSSKHLNADLGAKIIVLLIAVIRQRNHLGSKGFAHALFF